MPPQEAYGMAYAVTAQGDSMVLLGVKVYIEDHGDNKKDVHLTVHDREARAPAVRQSANEASSSASIIAPQFAAAPASSAPAETVAASAQATAAPALARVGSASRLVLLVLHITTTTPQKTSAFCRCLHPRHRQLCPSPHPRLFPHCPRGLRTNRWSRIPKSST